MNNQKLRYPTFSSIGRLFFLSLALISYAPCQALAVAQNRSEEVARAQEPNQQEQSQQQEQAEDEEEREIKVKHRNHPALEIKAIRNHKKKSWLRDLEIEVTNTTNKPIYFIKLVLLFPENKPRGYVTGEHLEYGNSSLMDWAKRPTPDDIPLKPGESHIFKLPKDRRELWEENLRIRPEDRPLMKKLELEVREIRFGDGTGFWDGDRFFRSKPRRISSSTTSGGKSQLQNALKELSDTDWKNSKWMGIAERNNSVALRAFPKATAIQSDVEFCPGNGCNDRYKLNSNVTCYSWWDGNEHKECKVDMPEQMSAGDTTNICANSEVAEDKVCRLFETGAQQRCLGWKLVGCGPNAGQIITGDGGAGGGGGDGTGGGGGSCAPNSNNPHFICNSETQVCQPVNSCGENQGNCAPGKTRCCDAPNQIFKTHFICNRNTGKCTFAATQKCDIDECNSLQDSCPITGGGGSDPGGGGGGYCTDYWWVETDWLCNGDYSSCVMVGSNVSYAGCW